jgi:hypothetical protein
MTRHRALPSKRRSRLIYDGPMLLGAVRPRGAGYLAFDRGGKPPGIFPSLAQTYHSVRSTLRLIGGGGDGR